MKTADDVASAAFIIKLKDMPKGRISIARMLVRRRDDRFRILATLASLAIQAIGLSSTAQLS